MVRLHMLALVLEDTRGELVAIQDVDKWALSSCLMCFFGSFGDSNSPLPTYLVVTRGELLAIADVDKSASNSCLMCHFGGFADANSALPTKRKLTAIVIDL